jgi:hypothetical protein
MRLVKPQVQAVEHNQPTEIGFYKKNAQNLELFEG